MKKFEKEINMRIMTNYKSAIGFNIIILNYAQIQAGLRANCNNIVYDYVMVYGTSSFFNFIFKYSFFLLNFFYQMHLF